MRYYLKEGRRAVAREDEKGHLYRWDWSQGAWVHDIDLIRKIKLGDDWWDEVPEAEALKVIEERGRLFGTRP